MLEGSFVVESIKLRRRRAADDVLCLATVFFPVYQEGGRGVSCVYVNARDRGARGGSCVYFERCAWYDRKTCAHVSGMSVRRGW